MKPKSIPDEALRLAHPFGEALAESGVSPGKIAEFFLLQGYNSDLPELARDLKPFRSTVYEQVKPQKLPHWALEAARIFGDTMGVGGAKPGFIAEFFLLRGYELVVDGLGELKKYSGYERFEEYLLEQLEIVVKSHQGVSPPLH